MLFKERTLAAKVKSARRRARRDYIKAHNGYILPPWIEVHHVDFCPLNNDPANWEALTKWAHIDLHSANDDKDKSRNALHAYLDKELKESLRELTLLCNIHNTEYDKYEMACV